ncbi:hypothetical protein WN943_021351 [Citrus x changshan-huyou]
MATDDNKVSGSKPSNSKWFFSNKGHGLSLHRRRSKSKSSSSSSTTTTLSSPNSSLSACEPKKITKEDELKQVFRHFDGDGDGKISALELRAYFGSIGEYMSYEEARAAIDDFDTDGDSLLDFQDFTRMLLKDDRGDGDDEDLKKAFEMFELEKKGCITPKGLQRMLNRLGDSKSYDECVAMIQVFDTDGNGVLDYHEFSQMMA